MHVQLAAVTQLSSLILISQKKQRQQQQQQRATVTTVAEAVATALVVVVVATAIVARPWRGRNRCSSRGAWKQQLGPGQRRRRTTPLWDVVDVARRSRG